VGESRNFLWEWQGRPIKVAYETLGPGPRAVLLLPAFSTVSSREEMRPLAECLANQGCSWVLVDWPGFGESTRGRFDYGPRLYHKFLADFAATLVCRGPRRSSAGHAASYALVLARDRPGVWSHAVLLATWRGPLPTAMGVHPRAYAWVRGLVGSPVALLHGSTSGRSQPPQRHLREANVLRPPKLEHPV
jgi:pimeloyl-ACP methyl ester carboxylesterase